MGFSLRRLVTLGAFAVALCSLATLGVLSYPRGKNRLENETFRQMEQLSGFGAELAARPFRPAPAAPDSDGSSPRVQPAGLLDGALFNSLGGHTGYRVSVIDRQGRLLADSKMTPEQLAQAENHRKRPEVAQALAAGLGKSKRFSPSEGLEYLYLARAFKLDDGTELVLRLGQPFKKLLAERDNLFQDYVVALLTALALAVIMSQILGRLFFNPLNEIVLAARALAQGDLSYRIRHYPANELAEIGRVFDRMAGRLDNQIALTAQSRDYLRAVLEATSEGVLVTDHRGRITLANPAFMDLFGLTANPEGLTPAEAVRLPKFIEAFQRAGPNRKIAGELITLSEPAPKTLEVTINPIIEQGSAFSGGLVAVFHDLTNRQKLYQMRRDFVANVSHELRTPLTALIAAVEALRESAPAGSGAFQDFINIIDRQSQRLHQLTQGLLRLARLEAPPAEGGGGQFALSELLDKIKERVAGQVQVAEAPPDAPSPGQTYLIIKRPPGDIKLAGDQETLFMAVANLVDNAIKYGPLGQTITLSVIESPKNLIIEVADQGPGIPPSERERVFERFYRLERSRGRSGGGAGLGLALVKHAVRRHNGEIILSSGPEGGAVFQIKLPRGPA